MIDENEKDEQSLLNQKDKFASINPVKEIELEAIRLAEDSENSITTDERNQKIIEALEIINKGLSMEQDEEEMTASLLNNKAQILRLLKTRDSEARECLDRAISICESYPNDKRLKSTVLKQSLAQRGWLKFRSGDDEEGFEDFERAAQLGCLESRRMAVRCNPYAAMCNQMLKEVMNNPKFYS